MTRYHRLFAAALFLSLLLSHCATLQSVPLEERSRLVPAPYEPTFRAVMQALIGLGYGIASTDKDAGLIVTEYLRFERPMLNGDRYKTQSRYHVVLVPVGEEQTQITLRIDYEEITLFGGVNPMPMTSADAERFYKDSLDSIETWAKRYTESKR